MPAGARLSEHALAQVDLAGPIGRYLDPGVFFLERPCQNVNIVERDRGIDRELSFLARGVHINPWRRRGPKVLRQQQQSSQQQPTSNLKIDGLVHRRSPLDPETYQIGTCCQDGQDLLSASSSCFRIGLYFVVAPVKCFVPYASPARKLSSVGKCK